MNNITIMRKVVSSKDYNANRLKRMSEEDENKLNHILEIVHIASGSEASVDEKEELESFLKSLRLQPKRGWDEEDERMLNVAIRSCEQTIEDHPNDTIRFKDCINWLKSLRPSWKPSEEQMEALMLAIEGKCPLPTSYMSRRLEDLYEGLVNTYNIECKLK